MSAVLLLASLTGAQAASRVVPAGTSCKDGGSTPDGPPALVDLLDSRGWLVGHRLDLPGTPDRSVALGRVAFLDGPFDGRWVFGDATGSTTRIRILDGARDCVEETFDAPGYVFETSIDPTDSVLVYDLVDPKAHEELGIWLVPLAGPGGASQILRGVPSSDPIAPIWANTFSWQGPDRLAVESCGAVRCETRSVALVHPATTSGRRPLSGSLPVLDPRPVPESDASPWATGTVLAYRWGADPPAAFMKPVINAAADDVTASRGSLAARFVHDQSGDGQIDLTAEMDAGCTRQLACVYRFVPKWGFIRIRPQGAEVNWGTVHWCQAYDDPPVGCFDLERVMLEVFGGIEGLEHPEDSGYRLGATQTIMSADVPAKGDPGWQMHRFGPCDVARLQRRYDVPSAAAPLAMCDRVDTALDLAVSDGTVTAGQPVTVTATLRVGDAAPNERLAGDRLSGRAVVIERRVSGSSGWTSFVPDPGPTPGSYVVTFRPSATSDFRATFAGPSDEGVSGAVSAIISVTVVPCDGHTSCPT